MKRRTMAARGASLVLMLAGTTAFGQFEIGWFTVDSGGQMFSTGGAYSLGGTIGQHDAGPAPLAMTGGASELVGGFWPAAIDVCPLPGDMNLDGQRDGVDVQTFVNCLIGAGAPSCSCADVDGNGSLTTADADAFVQVLLAG